MNGGYLSHEVKLANRGSLVRLRPKTFLAWLNDFRPSQRRLRRLMERYLAARVEAALDKEYGL